MILHKVKILLIIFMLNTLSNEACFSADIDNKLAKKELTRSQMESDICYFFDKFEKVHPNPYYIFNSSSLDSIKQSLILNLPDSMNNYELWKLLSIKLKPIFDAHTRFDYFPISIFNSEKGLLFPKIIGIDSNNDVFIDKNKKIISINNVCIESIIKDFFDVFSMENKLTSLMFLQNVFPIVVRSYFGEQKTFIVAYMKENIQFVDTIKAISYEDFLRKTEIYNNEYRIIEHGGKKIMYVHYINFENLCETQELTDKIFFIIKEEKINSLVIDLRDNGGGNSQCTDFIEDYIYNNIYKTESSIIRNSKDYRSVFRTDNFLDKFVNRYSFEIFIMKKSKIRLKGEKKVRNNNISKYVGDVFVLVSPLTHSCAADLAYRIKLNNRGLIIGSGIGQSIHNFTNIREFKLNESEIRFFIPTTECFFKNIPCEKNFLKMDYKMEFQCPIDLYNDLSWISYVVN